MEPLDENELRELLRKWDAPSAPRRLNRRVFPPRRPWWSWLLTGSLRVPVPLALGAVLLLALWIHYFRPERPAARGPQPESVSLSDFQPVRHLEPVLVSGREK